MNTFRILVAVAALTASSSSAATYRIDPVHSAVTFTVRHFVTKIHGSFTKFTGTFDYDAKAPVNSKVDVKIDPASIDTHVEKRDNHLRGGDFFDVAKCSEMTFKSTKVELTGDKGKLHGILTMHCVTKPVVLDLELGGEAKDPKGNAYFGASATGKLNRADWDISAFKGMIGDDVSINIDVEAKPAVSSKS